MTEDGRPWDRVFFAFFPEISHRLFAIRGYDMLSVHSADLWKKTMALGPYRQEDVTRLRINRVINPSRGGKELRLRVGRREILVELSVRDVQELGDVAAGDWVEIILHSLVEHAFPGRIGKYEVEPSWANGKVLGRVDELAGGRWNGIIFDLGNGLKSYVDIAMEASFDDRRVRTGEWWRFEFTVPHQCMMIRKAAPEAESPPSPGEPSEESPDAKP